jgi:hypothetical protein
MSSQFPASFLILTLLLPSSATATNPQDFYTQIGTDPSFQSLVDNGTLVPGERFSLNTVPGSTIDVHNTLLETNLTGPTGPIPQDFRIHTQTNGSVQRPNFFRFPRWYQEDGNVQVMRLFEGEQNVRDGIGENGTPGRIEAFYPILWCNPEPGASGRPPTPSLSRFPPISSSFSMRAASCGLFTCG